MPEWDDEQRPKQADIPNLLVQLDLSAPENKWKVYHDLVWAYFDADEYTKALEAFNACKDKVPDEMRTMLIIRVSDSLTESGEIDEAVTLVTKRLQEVEKRGEGGTVGAARLQLNIAYARWRQGSFDEAMDRCQLALAIFTNRPDIPTRDLVLVLTTMGLILWEKGDYPMALKFSEQAKEEAIKAGLNDRLMWIHNNMGLVHYQLGEYDEALNLYESAMALAKAQGDKYCQALVNINVGLVLQDQGDLNKAEERFREGLRISEEIENFVSAALAYVNIGNVSLDKGELEAARTAIDESMSLCRHMKEKWLLSANRIGMARVYIAKGDLKLARHNAEEALRLAGEMKAKESKGGALRDLGRIEELEGRKENARKYFEDALAIFESMNSRSEVARTLLALGKFLALTMGDPAAGKPMLERAMDIAKELGAQGIMREVEAALKEPNAK